MFIASMINHLFTSEQKVIFLQYVLHIFTLYHFIFYKKKKILLKQKATYFPPNVSSRT